MFSPEEVAKFPIKNISADKFIKLAEIEQKWIHEKIKNLDNGQFLAVWFNKKTQKWYRLHLQKIWMKPYSLSYRTTKTKDGKAREGKELLISNMPLPKGDIVRK